MGTQVRLFTQRKQSSLYPYRIPGVGKTSLTYLMAHNEALTSPGWTVGCSVEVRLHDYKEGTPQQTPYFVEYWDVGGSISHKNTRNTFYSPTQGIILVHELTNRKSHDNLQKWLLEILNKDGKDTAKNANDSIDIPDPEQFFGSTQVRPADTITINPTDWIIDSPPPMQIPILVVGTKSDLLDEHQRTKRPSNSNSPSIATQCGADEIHLNCHDSKSLAPGTNDAVKLSRFLDKVIERKHNAKEASMYGDRRRYTTPFTSPITSPYGSPFYTSSYQSPTYNNN